MLNERSFAFKTSLYCAAKLSLPIAVITREFLASRRDIFRPGDLRTKI